MAMSDLHQTVRFGANVDPTANDPSWPLQLTRAIERAGLELIGIQDHPYNADFLDTWTLIATLLQATERVHMFPNVANLPLHPPVMLAKAAATLDVLSGGRVELGLGAGAFREGIEAMGGPGRSKGESIEALEEAVQIVHAFWSGTPALRFEGKHYTVKGAHPATPGSLHRNLARLLWPTLIGTHRAPGGWLASQQLLRATAAPAGDAAAHQRRGARRWPPATGHSPHLQRHGPYYPGSTWTICGCRRLLGYPTHPAVHRSRHGHLYVLARRRSPVTSSCSPPKMYWSMEQHQGTQESWTGEAT